MCACSPSVVGKRCFSPALSCSLPPLPPPKASRRSIVAGTLVRTGTLSLLPTARLCSCRRITQTALHQLNLKVYARLRTSSPAVSSPRPLYTRRTYIPIRSSEPYLVIQCHRDNCCPPHRRLSSPAQCIAARRYHRGTVNSATASSTLEIPDDVRICASELGRHPFVAQDSVRSIGQLLPGIGPRRSSRATVICP